MKWGWPPRSRAREAERHAEAAEAALAITREQHRKALQLANEARKIKRENGFTNAIRAAMGVGQ